MQTGCFVVTVVVLVQSETWLEYHECNLESKEKSGEGEEGEESGRDGGFSCTCR